MLNGIPKRLSLLILALLIVIFLMESRIIYHVIQSKIPATKTRESSNNVVKSRQFTDTIIELGQEEEFTIGRNGDIIYKNKATDVPKVIYRISVPRHLYSAKWQDLRVGDKVNLTITYDDQGRPQYRTLFIYR